MSEPRASAPLPGDRLALIAVSAMFFSNGAVYASWVARIPELRDQVDVSLGALGVLLGVAGGFGLLGSVAAGFTVDRFGSRAIIIGSGLALCGSLIVVGTTGSALVLAGALALLALTDTLTDVGMNVQGAQISARRRRPVVNRLHGLWSLGAVTGGLVASGAAGSGTSLALHLTLVAAVLALTVAIAGAGLLRRDNRLVEAAAGGRRAASMWRPLALLAALGFLATSVELVPSDWAALRLTDDLGAGPDTAGLGFVAFAASMLMGRLVGDVLVERLGAGMVMRSAPLVSGAGLAIATLSPSVFLSLGGFALAGLGASVLFPLIYARAAETPGVNPGRGLAFMTAGQKIAALALPLAVGALASLDAFSVGQAVAALVLPSAVGLLAIGLWNSRRRGAAA